MSTLSVYGNEIHNVFELLGENENDITYSTGWVLSKSKVFLESVIKSIIDRNVDCENCIIRLQEYKEKDRGYTDIEIFVEKELFFIIEAKRGWNLPAKKQLLRYMSRFKEYKSVSNKVIVISECKRKYAENELEKHGLKIPVTFISWQTILHLTKETRTKVGHYEKNLLDEYHEYLQGVITVRDIKSNLVFCVSLGHDKPDGSHISWIDIVEKKHKYFYPVGSGWPSEPPNYLAFRYYGKLQSIHHIEDYEIVEQLHERIPEIDADRKEDLHYVLKLGPAFKPEKEVKNGKIWTNAHYWCMLDTLFTCKTIREARDLTKNREEMGG